MSKSIQELNTAKFNKWLENKQIHTIDSSLITLTEKVHTQAKSIPFKENYLNEYREQECITRTIVIKPCQDGYSLITGYKWLMLAKALNKPINAVIVGEHMTRYKLIDRLGLIYNENILIPDDTEMVYPIHKIKIPYHMRNSKPSQWKLDKYREYLNANGTVDKAITVKQDRNNKSKVVLQNEYIRFLLLRREGVRYIPVKFVV